MSRKPLLIVGICCECLRGSVVLTSTNCSCGGDVRRLARPEIAEDFYRMSDEEKRELKTTGRNGGVQ